MKFRRMIAPFKTFLFLTLILSLSVTALAYEEAPMLKEKVEAGELPPVDERLPEDPLVIEPVDKVGKYGGTWTRFSTDEEWAHFRMSLDGDKFIRWTKDALGNAPNLLTDWESNEDRTVWTLHFRKGVKWSDGEPFTVDDVLFWWEEMALNEEHSEVVPKWAISGGKTMEMVKVDDYTLKFEYVAPYPLLVEWLCMYPWISPGFISVPEHYMKQFHPDYSDKYQDFEIFEEKQEWWHNVERPVLNAWIPVQEQAGKRLVMERNPYYYAVDTAGNQLPYIDKINVRYVADNEVFKLKVAQGESDMQIRPGVLTLRDVATLKANENKNNFKTLMWDSGSGTGPLYYPNRNHPNPEKAELYRNPKFLKALSYAINRDRVNKMIYYGTGFNTTGTFSPKTPFFNRSELGKETYKKWRDLAVEYDPEKSASLLDEIGIVDQDGDGWRDLPSGKELKLRIDTDSEANIRYTDCGEIVKENWREVGLKTIVNPIDGSQIQVMQSNGTIDIRNSWEVGGVPTIVGFPHWLVPIDNGRWAPLYGVWYRIKGTAEEGAELDKKPRDRTPPRAEPPAGGPVAQLQELYDEARSATTIEKMDEIVAQMIDIHIEHGPFIIGTVAGYPRIGVVKDRMKNVPDVEQLAQGGWINPWNVCYIAIINPDQFYIDEG